MAFPTLVILAAALCLLASLATASYHQSEAEAALYYCKASYCDPDNLPTWSCSVCTSHHSTFTDVSVQNGPLTGLLSFTGYNPPSNQIVVAFRGSSNIKNWIADLNFTFTNYSNCDNCQVHQGFYEAWHDVSVDLLSSVSSLVAANSGAEILVTGHSLGAATALLCALHLSSVYPGTTLKLYTFGEPRVGNPTFVQWAVTQLSEGVQYRVTHASDPVPHVPPLDFGFLHVPHELWYDNNGNSTFSHCQDSSSGEDPNCSDSVIAVDIFDHLRYLGSCTKCDSQPNSITGLCPL